MFTADYGPVSEHGGVWYTSGRTQQTMPLPEGRHASMDLQLRDAVAMVVGATGGIGSAVAEAFGAEGSRLALVGRDETKLARPWSAGP